MKLPAINVEDFQNITFHTNILHVAEMGKYKAALTHPERMRR